MSNRRTQVEIELEDDLLFRLMLRAHERDITLNQLVEQILREYIENNPLPADEHAT